MTAPVSPLSPIAGFVNALLRLTITRLDARITGLEQLLADARNTNHALRTARDFADSDAAGYIDRTGLEDTRA